MPYLCKYCYNLNISKQCDNCYSANSMIVYNQECPVCFDILDKISMMYDCGHFVCKSCHDNVDTSSCCICKKEINIITGPIIKDDINISLPNKYKDMIEILEQSKMDIIECIIFARWIYTLKRVYNKYVHRYPYPKLNPTRDYVNWFNNMVTLLKYNKIIKPKYNFSFPIDVEHHKELSMFPIVYQEYSETFGNNYSDIILGNNYTLDIKHAYKVTIRTITDKSVDVNYYRNDTVLMIKQKVEHLTGVSKDIQNLVSGGRILYDDLKLDNRYDNKVMHLVLNLRGD